MKTTNFQTPRSLSECEFDPCMDPIEGPSDAENRIADLVVVVGSLAAALLSFFAIALQ